MSFTISQINDHLDGMGHGTTTNKITNIEALHERAAATFLVKCHPLEVIRNATMANLVHDDVYNYSLPSDFGSIIDLIPDDERESWDRAVRNRAGQFDLEKAIKNQTLSIEAVDGTKFARINWRTRQGKVLNELNSLTGNGTWSAQGSATNVVLDTIFKKSGSASVRFDLVASGDGIKNTTMTAVDLTDEDEIADVFVWVYFPSITNLTSISAVWGNDLTTKYWTSTAQTTQADGSAFKTGWNLLKFSWSAATETGTVAPATIDSFKLTVAATGAIVDIRVDNIIFSIGRPFDLKYYSKYLFKDGTTGTWKSIPTSDNDIVMIDNDSLPQYLMECLIQMSQQKKGKDAAFDINHAIAQLSALYPAYKGLYPSQVKKVVGKIGGLPFRTRRFTR